MNNPKEAYIKGINTNNSQSRPLSHLVEVEEKIEFQNEWRTRVNLWIKKEKLEKNIHFCPLLNYPKSNCNSKRYNDGNCFESKTPGCTNGKLYLGLLKHTKNERFSLYASSYLSKVLDIPSNLLKLANLKITYKRK